MYLVRKSANGIQDSICNNAELYQIEKSEFEETRKQVIGVNETLYGFKLFSLNENVSIAFFNSNGLYFCGAVTDKEYKTLVELSSKSDNNINLE
jgi:hypothetical protein